MPLPKLGDVLIYDAISTKVDIVQILGQIKGVFNGQGVTIPTSGNGSFFDVQAPFSFTILGWTLIGDQTGSAIIDIQKDTYANYPPTGTDSIVASAPPTITSALKATSTTLTGWTTLINNGDILRFVVSSCSGFTNLNIMLNIRRA